MSNRLSPDGQHCAPASLMRGTPAYRRAMGAMFVAGAAIFALVFCLQPLLPNLVEAFAVDAADSALAQSLSTTGLAVAILLSCLVGEILDRRKMMFLSMLGAGLVAVLGSVIADWHLFLATRFLCGLLLGGMPAVAMAYLAEEVAAADVGRASALYIAGTGFGAMVGRVAAGIIADHTSWRIALAAIGVLTLLGSLAFGFLLPRSRRSPGRQAMPLKSHIAAWERHLANRQLRILIVLGFVLGGVFVSFFNFIGFVLMRAPFGLSQTTVSLILFVYTFGIVASVIAGELAAHYGPVRPLATGLLAMGVGIGCTMTSSLTLVVAGIVILTMGFFVGQAIATGWIGQVANGDRAHAAVLYLLSYYFGASLMGWIGGKLWDHSGWWLVAATSIALVLAASILALAGGLVALPSKSR